MHHHLFIRSPKRRIFQVRRITCLKRRSCLRHPRNTPILPKTCTIRYPKRRPNPRNPNKSSPGKSPRGKQREYSPRNSLNHSRSRNLNLNWNPSPLLLLPLLLLPPLKNHLPPIRAELRRQQWPNGRHTATHGMRCPKSSDTSKPLPNTGVLPYRFFIRRHLRGVARTSCPRPQNLPDVRA